MAKLASLFEVLYRNYHARKRNENTSCNQKITVISFDAAFVTKGYSLREACTYNFDPIIFKSLPDELDIVSGSSYYNST
jgi:hypothetical protein